MKADVIDNEDPRVHTNDLYLYLHQSDKKTSAQINKFEKMKEDKELGECTFKPSTNHSKQAGKRDKITNKAELEENSQRLHGKNKEQVLTKLE